MAYPVARYAKKYGIPLSLANALIGQESGGQAGVRSPKGATGLTQVMPDTYVGMYGGTREQAVRKLRNPSVALDAGFRYLAQQKKNFGSWRLALAAYNAGPGAVKEYDGIPPYAETQNYVKTIMSRAKLGATSVSPARPGPPRSPSAAPFPEIPGPLPASQVASPRATYLQNALPALIQGNYDPTQMVASLLHPAQEAPAASRQLTGSPITAQGLTAPRPSPRAPAPRGKGDWGKFVRLSPSADREGVRTQGAVLQFVGHLGAQLGKPLTIGTGTNHNRLTVNGNVSNHWNGMAADIPAEGARLRQLGYLALLQAGMDPKEAAQARKTGGLFNVGPYQIIFATKQGGNHYNHLHVGIKG